jgi:hypothetical protein
MRGAPRLHADAIFGNEERGRTRLIDVHYSAAHRDAARDDFGADARIKEACVDLSVKIIDPGHFPAVGCPPFVGKINLTP